LNHRINISSKKISGINVAHFISELALNNEIWSEWKGKMPVIYNKHD